MSILGVISSDATINKTIAEAFKKPTSEVYDVRFLEEENRILEFLNYDLPEIVIINFSDSKIDIDYIVKQIIGDSWLHNFGIIGLFDQEKANEEELLKKLKEVNILALLNTYRIRSHILKSVQIIERNYQIIFQKELSPRLFEKASGSFTIRNDILAVPIYAGIAATMLSQRGLIDPDSKMHLQLCLAELIINGVEHGNCGITFEEKTSFMDSGLSVVELVEEKCRNPKIAERTVTLDWEIESDATKFIIKDQGDGFDVKGLNEKIEREGPMALHGRGIRMANLIAKKIEYNDIGNEVTITVGYDESATRITPVGFTGEEAVYTRPNDIVINEGEASDYLYYIAGGTFSVFHKGRHVGVLSPTDIFMGEMSFLLNKRRSATIRAETSGKLIKISRKAFVSVIKEYPHYGIFLSKLLAKRLVRANAINATVRRKKRRLS